MLKLNYKAIKAIMGIPYDYADDAVIPIIDDTAFFLLNAGVKKEIVESPLSYGCIATGAKDTYNFESGNIKYSPLFYLKLIQLAGIDSLPEGLK